MNPRRKDGMDRRAAYVKAHLAAGLCAQCPNERHPGSKRHCSACLAKYRSGNRARTGSTARVISGRGRPTLDLVKV